MNFIFVEYGNQPYPDGIKADLVEVAGHLDKTSVPDISNYSLHTEYSYGKRNLASNLIRRYPKLYSSNKDGVPQLWKDKGWAVQFASFVHSLTNEHAAPTVIEIHPPFNDYSSIDSFLDFYTVFEEKIHAIYPDVKIVVENRAGSIYRGGKFVVSAAEEIAELCKKIRENNVRLGVVLDFPQLLTGELIHPECFDRGKYTNAVHMLVPYREVIKGIHIWGKKRSSTGRFVAHTGDLNTLFPDVDDKKVFLNGIKAICDDEMSRFLVPEVNSGGEDLRSVVKDVLSI